MLFSYLRVVMACALTVAPIYAESSLVVTLASVRDRIRSQNPDLAAARLRIQEALGRMNQAGRLANPELETSFQHDPGFKEGAIEIGISQRFPITQRLRLEKEVSHTEMLAAEGEVKNVERILAAEASSGIVEVLAIRQHKLLLDEQTELSRSLADQLQKAAEKGEASLLDAAQIRIETLRAAAEIHHLNASEATALGKLKPLLGMRLDENLIVSGTLPDPTMPTANTSPLNRPDYQAARLYSLAANQNETLEQARRLDDIEGGFFLAGERLLDNPTGSRNETAIGIRAKITLPFWNNNQGKIEEARATRTRKQLETLALARLIELEAEAALGEMREWAKLTKEINTALLPLAAEHVKNTQAAFKTGQAELQAVLRAREQSLKLANSRIESLRGFHLARVRYQSALGQP